MQSHISKLSTANSENHADNSITGVFVGSGFSLFGFLLLIVLLA